MTTRRKNAAPLITVSLESSGVPLYRQIYETLRRSILSGHFPAESQMPSTRALAARLAVSRMTIVTAYELLLAEGYIEGKSGSETYVAKVLPEQMLEVKDKKPLKIKADVKDNPRLPKGGRQKTLRVKLLSKAFSPIRFPPTAQ